MEIVWIASYPKSGNTWIRFLFTHLLHGPFEHSDTIFEVTPVLERGIDPASLRSDRKNFIKTHFKFGSSLPWLDQAVGVIYVVRNPFDVMLSNLNYFFLTSGDYACMSQDERQQFANAYVTSYLREGGDLRWKRLNYGTWREHAESWTRNAYGIPVTAVRYEDLLADTEATLNTVCKAVGLDVTPERIAEAARLSDFAHMRAMEEREIAARRPGMFYRPEVEASTARGFRFMNKGKEGRAREALPVDMIRRFRDAFAPAIDEFGYG